MEDKTRYPKSRIFLTSLLFKLHYVEQCGTMKKMGERRGKEEMKELGKIFWNAVCMVKRGKS